MSIDDKFIKACVDNKVELAKQLLKERKDDIDLNIISKNKEDIFRYSCYYGNLEMAKWLLEIKPNIDISAENEYAFRHACIKEHIELVKWLLRMECRTDSCQRVHPKMGSVPQTPSDHPTHSH